MERQLTLYLIKAQKTGKKSDRDAFILEVYRRHHILVLLIANSYFPAYAEDAVQDFYCKLCTIGLNTIRPSNDRKLKNCLLTMARNCYVDAWRRKRYQQYVEFTESIDCPEYRQVNFHKEELSSVMEELLLSLPKKQQMAVRLMLEGFFYEEIARMLHTTPGAVKNLIYRAKIRLRGENPPPIAM